MIKTGLQLTISHFLKCGQTQDYAILGEGMVTTTQSPMIIWDVRVSIVFAPFSVLVPTCTQQTYAVHAGTNTEIGTSTKLGRRSQEPPPQSLFYTISCSVRIFCAIFCSIFLFQNLFQAFVSLNFYVVKYYQTYILFIVNICGNKFV